MMPFLLPHDVMYTTMPFKLLPHDVLIDELCLFGLDLLQAFALQPQPLQLHLLLSDQRLKLLHLRLSLLRHALQQVPVSAGGRGEEGGGGRGREEEERKKKKKQKKKKKKRSQRGGRSDINNLRGFASLPLGSRLASGCYCTR